MKLNDEHVDGELEFHLEMRRRELVAGGMTPEDAERAALKQFGDLERARRECRALNAELEADFTGGRRMPLIHYVRDAWRDAGGALRQMRVAPGFTAVALLTLALGIGATTAIFSTFYAVVLRPLPVPHPDRIVAISETWNGSNGSNVSAGNFVDMAAEQTTMDAVAASVTESMTLSREEGAARIIGARVSGQFFDVFGVEPERGRVLGMADDEPGRDQVVVLSHRLWTGQFGARQDIVGQTVTIDARPYTVIGVMPASFDFTTTTEWLWVPIAFSPAQRALHDEHYLDVYGRLRPGVPMAQAAADLDAIGQRLAQRFPQDNTGRTLAVGPMMSTFVGDYGQRLFVLLGAVGLVLLIACANVSSLLLARGAARTRELAVRMALGAGRGRVVRQLFTENLVLGLVSAAAGVFLAGALIRFLVVAAPAGVPRLEQAQIDAATLTFTVVLAVAATVIFGLMPAWRASQTDITTTLKESVRGAGGRGTRDLLRTTLVAAEVALVLVLLVGAGLLIRTAMEMGRLKPGFDPDGVFSARFSLPASKYASAAALLSATRELEDTVRTLPGVGSAAISSAVPGFGSFTNGLVPELEPNEPKNRRQSRARFVSPSFFRTIGLPVVKGRDFADTDRQGTPLVMIVNQTLAERLFPGQDPIGRKVFCCSGGPKTIVGVAGDVRALGPSQPIEPEFYLPLAQVDDVAWSWTRRTLFVVARTSGDPGSLGPPIRRAFAGVDRGVALFSMMPMNTRMSRTLDTARFNTQLLVLLGAAGLLLAAVGIYGVIAYFTNQRLPEIGIRIALGASRTDVLRLVTGQAAVPVLAGIVVGTVGAVFASRLIATQLVNVGTTDFTTYAVVVLGLAIVASGAALIPARRAARLDASRTLLIS